MRHMFKPDGTTVSDTFLTEAAMLERVENKDRKMFNTWIAFDIVNEAMAET